ncbi:unnamed protein product [Schistosoma intercalatum]|nr:unnamed protein product [Schistosoma intercalatum]
MGKSNHDGKPKLQKTNKKWYTRKPGTYFCPQIMICHCYKSSFGKSHSNVMKRTYPYLSTGAEWTSQGINSA